LKSFVKKENLDRNVEFLGLLPYNKVLEIYAEGESVRLPIVFAGLLGDLEVFSPSHLDLSFRRRS